ncbi:MAG: hypothetical protein WC554_04245 [Clostridia bacterium]|jgi:Ni,Fe-hydrogenase I large subunit
MNKQGPDFSSLADKWPSAIVARHEIEKFTGGVITAKYLANLDCQGLGPKIHFKIGKKVTYVVKEFITWLESRATTVQKDYKDDDR